MPDNINMDVRSSGDSSAASYVSGSDTGATTSTTVKTADGSVFVIRDTTDASNEPHDEPIYARSPGHPKLSEPDPSAPTDDAFNTVNPDDMMQRLLDAQEASDTPPPGSLAAQRKEALAKVQVDDPEIVALAEKEGLSPGEVQQDLQMTSNVSFKQMIKDMPEEDQQKLLFARSHPEASNLSPELQAKLKEINAAVTKSVGESVGFGSDWGGVPIDSSYLDLQVMDDFEDSFENNLRSAVDDGIVTEDQYKKLITMYYMPGAYAGDTDLQVKFQTFRDAAVGELQQRYGFKSDYRPPVDNSTFTQTTNGAFRAHFKNELNNTSPPLTDAQKDQIMAYYNNPNDPSLPKDPTQLAVIKTLANAIKGLSTAAVIKEFGLEPTWLPIVTSINNPAMDMGLYGVAKGGVELLNKLFKTISGNLSGEQQEKYSDYLKAVSEALNVLQQFLYSLEGSDAALSSKMSKANSDTTLSNIALQMKTARDLARKLSKAKHGIMGFMGKIAKAMAPMDKANDWMGKITTLVISCVIAALVFPIGGPVLAGIIIAAALFNVIDSAVAQATGKPSLTQQMSKAVNDAVPGGCGWIVTGLMSVVLSGGNPMLYTTLLTSDTNTVQNMVKCFGGDEAAQQITAAVFGAVAQIVCMVAMTAMAGPAELPEALANIAAKTIKIGTKTVCTVGQLAQGMMIAYTVSTGTLQTMTGVYQAKMEFLKGDIADIQAKLDGMSEEIQALVKAVMKVIAKFMETLSGRSDEIADISKTKSGIIAEQSQIVTELTG